MVSLEMFCGDSRDGIVPLYSTARKGLIRGFWAYREASLFLSVQARSLR